MLLLTFVLFIASVSGHAGHSHSHAHGPDHKSCGTKDLNPAELDLDMKRMRKWGRGRSRAEGSLETVCIGCVNINMYFHVFTNGTTPSPDHDPTVDPSPDDLLSDEGIANQMQVLTQQFTGSPFTFTLVETIRYINVSLANADERTQGSLVEAIHANRRGGKDVANVYWYSGSCKTECGEATFPNGLGIFPSDVYDQGDYIEMCPYCMANSLLDDRNPTLTHELGHWLGLLHTVSETRSEMRCFSGDD